MARRKAPSSAPEKEEKAYPVYDDFLYDDLQENPESSRGRAFPEDAEGVEHNRVKTTQVPMRSRFKSVHIPRETMEGYVPENQDDAPESSANGNAYAADDVSDTPEDAMRKFKQAQSEQEDETAPHGFGRKKKRERPMAESAANGDEPPKKHTFGIVLVTLLVTVVLASMVLSNVSSISFFSMPENALSRIVTPVQGFFSSLTDSVAGYLRTLKLRANLETEYNKLRAENEQLVYRAMLADELQTELSQYENMYDEVNANRDMNPIICQVIDRGDNNYFSTFVINRGSRDGIRQYMAVTISGALVGYTEEVKESSSTVRCIIDSEASIAALIQSSRDQGTVKGTLGIDGTYMCRMYYLSDDHLPRPGDTVVTSGVGMSFPKGIPIGTVRESTRGMDANKQYIVVEPLVDFEHIEYVIVLRYQPTAEAVNGRDSLSASMEYVPLETARPYPTLRISSSNFGTETPAPSVEATPSPTPSPTPTSTPRPTSTPAPTIAGPVYEYHPVATGPTAEPTATPSPSPTPYITLNPGDMTYEEDN